MKIITTLFIGLVQFIGWILAVCIGLIAFAVVYSLFGSSAKGESPPMLVNVPKLENSTKKQVEYNEVYKKVEKGQELYLAFGVAQKDKYVVVTKYPDVIASGYYKAYLLNGEPVFIKIEAKPEFKTPIRTAVYNVIRPEVRANDPFCLTGS